MRSLLIAAAGAAVLAAIALPAPTQAAKNCGVFTAHGALLHAKVTRGTAPCTTARRVLRRYLTSTASCSGSACVRFDAGWACSTAAVTAFPRLASCSRRGVVIAAYSFAD